MLISLLILPLLVQSIALNRPTKEHIVARRLEVFYCEVGETKAAFQMRSNGVGKKSCRKRKRKEKSNSEFYETYPN